MRKRGFTLIEVLIALVIFVVGALAVIRIFPPAFHVVQNSSYNNVATRLSDSILAQMKGDGSMPDAVFDINDTGSWASNPVEYSWLDQAGSVVGTVDKNFSLPKGPTDNAYSASALGHFRFIRGEQHEVQNSAGNDATSNSPYLLTNFSYTADSTGGVKLYVDLEITGVIINTEGRLDFSHATYTNPFTGTTENFHESGTYFFRPLEFKVSSGTVGAASNYAVLLFRSPITGTSGIFNTGARFYVSYRYGYGSLASGVINEPLNLPDDAAWNNDGGSNPSNDTSDCNYVLQGMLRKKLASAKPTIAAGSVRVIARAALVFVPSGTAVNLTNIAGGATIPLGISQDDGDRGFIKLPPVYADGPPVTSLMPDVSVAVDYLVPSWKVLFNQAIAGNDGKVVLPVSLLDSQFAPRGLVAEPEDSSPALLISPSSVDDKNGQVDYGTTYAGKTIRTAYQGLDQWARQISPSAQSYVPFIDNSTLTNFRDPTTPEYYYLPREQWREYLFASGGNVVYFHASEAGKTVQITFIPTGSTQPVQQTLTIDEAISAPGGISSAFASTGSVATLQLKDKNGDAINASGILGIYGLGVLARTAWMNGGSYEQSVVTGYRTANAD